MNDWRIEEFKNNSHGWMYCLKNINKTKKKQRTIIIRKQ